MHNHRELRVWKEARVLVKDIYVLSRKFPSDELYGLISQMRRAAVSVPSNIAEGCARESNKDFARFLSIALGSAYELETQIILSYDLEFIDQEEWETLDKKVIDIQKKLYNLRKKVTS